MSAGLFLFHHVVQLRGNSQCFFLSAALVYTSESLVLKSSCDCAFTVSNEVVKSRNKVIRLKKIGTIFSTILMNA